MSDDVALLISLNEPYEEVFLGGDAFHKHDAFVETGPFEKNGLETAGLS